MIRVVDEGQAAYGRRMVRAYTLRIELEEIKPAIWRRVVVPGNVTLARLHLVIQDAMGWQNYHLHLFEIGERQLGPVGDEAFGSDVVDEKRLTLEKMLEGKDRFRYIYDMGDDWGHAVVVEEVAAADRTIGPTCVAGARACPPENCGGPLGYEDLVKALARPRSKRHRDLREWIGDAWTAEAFDVDAADRRVARHRPRPRRAGGEARGGSRPRARA